MKQEGGLMGCFFQRLSVAIAFLFFFFFWLTRNRRPRTRYTRHPNKPHGASSLTLAISFSFSRYLAGYVLSEELLPDQTLFLPITPTIPNFSSPKCAARTTSRRPWPHSIHLSLRQQRMRRHVPPSVYSLYYLGSYSICIILA